ncbi:MAG: membrane integrity-associated transporter subunit PqiC [Sedimentisphaerales bacterium]|nr:membrane integrity-associated transporter subunit PqiC [Sedimentisphaerales bacterium]
MKQERVILIPWSIFIIITIFLYGCGNSNGRITELRHFLLQAERQVPPSSTSVEGVLCIRPFRVASPFAGDQLVYRTDQVTFEADYYKRFMVPPGPMITDQSQKWLSQSGLFSNVVDAGSKADINYTLEGWIFALYGDFSEKDNKAVLEIQAVLFREIPGENKIIMDRTYKIQASVRSRQVSDLIAGMNDCLHQFLSQIETDMLEALHSE